MRRWLVAVCAALLLSPCTARADVTDYLGRRIGTVSIERDGRPATDARMMNLVQTHSGEPLGLAAVRETITHLFSLGTFEDIRVRAAMAGEAVDLVYELRSLKPIRDLRFVGSVSGVDEGRLRRLVNERFGSTPRANRTADMAQLVQDDLRQVGFLNARAAARLSVDESADHATLFFDLTPGERARIGRIELVGDAGVPPALVFSRLDVAAGRLYERDRLTARIERFLEDRRAKGFLEARMSVSARPIDEGRTVDLTITAAQGPHVRVVFQGDPIPVDRQADLVPIGSEGSADEDLLEDSTVRIQEFLRAQGYRDARVSFTRAEREGELLITFDVTRGPQYRVGRFEVRGNSGITLEQIQERMKIRSGQPFSVASLNADMAALEDLYRREGYAAVEVNANTTLEERAAARSEVLVDIDVQIVEHARVLVNSMAIEGARDAAEAALRGSLGLQPGRPYFVTQLALDRDAIQLYYANRGYQSATVTTSATMSDDGAAVDVRFQVNEGVRVFVDHVLIVGNERTRAATIERELQFKSGDPLGLEAMSESQRRLSALGLFRRVRITELGHGTDARRDILVSVEEAPATTIGYGGGLQALQLLRSTDNSGAAADLQFGPRVFFETGRRNLFGKNRSINLFTRVSVRPQNDTDTRDFIQYRVIGTFREPRAIGTAADAYLTGTLEQERRSNFNFSRRAFNAQLGQKLTSRISVSGSYQIQRTELFFFDTIDPSQTRLIDRAFPQLRLSSFSLSGIRDTRDDITDPFKGLFLSVNGQLAGRRIGSEVGFAKTFLSAQQFTPINGHAVLATSVRLGMSAGFPRMVPAADVNGAPMLEPDGTPALTTVRDLPASERFFAGGDTTIRGFALDQVGAANTLDKDGFPIGGNGLLILNAELRVPVRGGLGVVGFIDAGNVFARTGEIDLRNLRSAVGFGIRYRSPIGPIRFDIGFKTHRNEVTPGNRETASAVHISLGQAF